MALALKDRVKETTIVVGTGAATLLGSSIRFQPFSVVGNGNTTYYCISDQFGSNWEVGIGTYSSSGNTLARTTVLSSSNAGALVVFTAGIKDVFVTYPAEKGVWYDASGNVLFTGTTTAANLAYTGTLTGSTGILNIGSGQLYKDTSGNVGIGVTPSTTLHVKSAAPQFRLETTGAVTTGGTVYNTLADSTSSIVWLNGFAGLANCYQFTTNFTNGFMRFMTGVQVEAMRIDYLGNVLVGATGFPSSSSKMLVSGDLNATYVNGVIQGQSKTAGDVSYPALYLSKFDNNSTTSQVLVRFAIGNYVAGQGQINGNGANAAAFGTFSDSRLKENIIDLPSQLDNILALRPVEYDYIESEGGGHQIGFIAQEVQEIYPDLVGEREDGMFTLSDMNKNDARLIKAIQELKAIIDTQQEQINSLLGK